jgi:WD40 repeat protein
VLRWSVETGQLLGVLALHHGSAKALCRGPGATYLSGGRDGVIRRSRVDGSADEWPVADTILNAVALSSDERVFATASRDHGVRIHASDSGEVVARFDEHRCSVKTVAWSSDGRVLAAGYYDGAILLWEPECANARLIHPAPPDAISQLSFLPDGNLLVGSWNSLGRAQILDRNGERVASLGGHARSA